MQNINLETLSLTEKWALLAREREQEDLHKKNIYLLRDSISKDEADLAKKEAEAKAGEVVESVPSIPTPHEENTI